MKARRFTLRALLFALLLAPFALGSWAKPLSAPSCHVPKTQHRTKNKSVLSGWAVRSCLVSRPEHRLVARLHRNRGKKINLQDAFVLAPERGSTVPYRFSLAPKVQQNVDGPNPSRGPPSHSC